MNTAKGAPGGAGIQTAALAFGSTGSPSTATELWNGTSWTTSPANLATARAYGSSAGSQTAALYAGGGFPSITANTEEFTGAAVATKTITTS